MTAPRIVLYAAGYHVDPAGQHVQHFSSHVRILAPRAGRHMKGMVGVGKELQCRACTELFDEGLQQLQVRKLVAASLHEQHRDFNIKEVITALV